MTDTLTTTTQIGPAVQAYYDRLLLERAIPSTPHARWGQKRDLPTKSGSQIKFRRYASLSTATTPLVEGVNPSPERLSKTDITAVPSKYGKVVAITEEVELTVEDDVMNETGDLLGENAGQTFDEITRDVLMSCASVTNASNGVNGSTPTEITKKDCQGITSTLLGNDAKMISSLVKAGTGQGTSPIRPAFWSVIHTDLIQDLEACSGFKHVANYAQQGPVEMDEWGAVDNVRFVICSNADYTSGSPNTYRLPVIGMNAYGVVKLKGNALKMIYHDPRIAGGPLEVYSTMGWKGWHVARVLNDNFMHLLKVSRNIGA